MLYLTLFYEFFKIGLFSVGGGLATLPFLYDIAEKYPWFSANELPDMIAVSQATPGPIGVNMATYAGFNSAGLLGSIIATIGLVSPSVIIIMLIASFLDNFKQNHYIESAFYGLRPAVTALITLAGFEVLKVSVLTLDTYIVTHQLIDLFNIKSLILFIIFSIASIKSKLHPILIIVIGAVCGIFLQL